MNGQLDLLTLIALVVAAAAIIKLRSVLGHRTDEDDARIQRSKAREQEAGKTAAGASASGEVINLPRRERPEPAVAAEPAAEDGETRVRAFTGATPAAMNGLLTILQHDRNFDPDPFLAGAGRAYEMIVTAFADGDKRTLKDLLTRDVYDGFLAAISDRDARGEKVDQTFVGIKKSEIAAAEVTNGIASITVRFVSELITAVRGPSGDVLSGDPQKVSEVTDVWTFSRDVSSRRALDNPNWKLEETQPPN